MSELNGRDALRKTEEPEKSQSRSILSSKKHQTEPGPTTEYESRKVMRCAERNDVIELLEIREHFNSHRIPGQYTVVERTSTYYGPELLLEAEGMNWRLTAPGPDTQLLLWSEDVNDRGFREKWCRLAEVEVEISDTSSYDICPSCGGRIRTEEHERLSKIDRCPITAND